MKEQLSSLEKFLLWCSGADRRILAQKECLSERYKYSAIGTTVLLTATMAFASGGYALFTIFASLPASIVGGSFWGLTIFNLDRLLISWSKRKDSNSQLILYTVTGVRLLIVLLLSLVVAKSLELRFFEDEINRELRENKIAGLEKIELNNIEQRLRESQAEKQNLYNDWREAERDANEVAARNVDSKNSNKSNLYQETKEFANILQQQLNRANNNVLQQQQEIYKVQQKIENILQSSQNNLYQSEIKLESILERLATLEKISHKYPIIKRIELLIASLLIIIEISPLLFKTLSGKGTYDVLLEQQTHEVYHGYLRDRQEENLKQATIMLENYLKSIMDFEREVVKHKENYLRAKEKSRENIHSRNVKNIRDELDRQHYQEILRFFNFCDREIENYLNIISNEIEDYPNVVRNINLKMVDSIKNENIIRHHVARHIKQK